MFKRILMSAVDETGSGANPPAATPAAPENVPQAQGATPTLTKEMADQIESLVSKAVAGVKDSIFAEARRTFTEKRNPKPAPETPSATPQAFDPAEERRMLRTFDRELARMKLSDQVSPKQYERAEKALLAERPEDVGAWAKDYFEGFGVAQTQPAPSPVTPSPKPVAEQPVSNRGAQPAARPIEEIDLLKATPDDIATFIRVKGRDAFKTLRDQQLRAVTITGA